MSALQGSRTASRQRRHFRIRKLVRGTAERPRLAVYKSLHHIAVQLIDDELGHTLVAASTYEAGIKKEHIGVTTTLRTMDAAAAVGTLVAERAREKGILAAVFDRSGYRYHGHVKALADAARAGGLEF